MVMGEVDTSPHTCVAVSPISILLLRLAACKAYVSSPGIRVVSFFTVTLVP